MKLFDVQPENVMVARGPLAALAQSPHQTWGVAVAADRPTLMVLYKAPHWDTPSVVQEWTLGEPKRAFAGFEALKRLFRDMNERTPMESVVRRLPRAEHPFPRRVG